MIHFNQPEMRTAAEQFLRAHNSPELPTQIPAPGSWLALHLPADGRFGGFTHCPDRAWAEDAARGFAEDRAGTAAVYDEQGAMVARFGA